MKSAFVFKVGGDRSTTRFRVILFVVLIDMVENEWFIEIYYTNAQESQLVR